jgi:molybdenum cofactor cytidylyltransferase
MSWCCGIILAGGRGERFGGAKAFAELPDGRTFLAACRDTLAAAGCAPIVATLPCDRPLPELEGVSVVALPRSDLAMFDSLTIALATALGHASWERAIVLPVDHPLVHAGTVRALGSIDAPAAIPVYSGKRGHPIAIARSIAAAVATGEYSGPTLREVLHAVGVVDVPVADAAVGANCNTPAALAAAWMLRGDV